MDDIFLYFCAVAVSNNHVRIMTWFKKSCESWKSREIQLLDCPSCIKRTRFMHDWCYNVCVWTYYMCVYVYVCFTWLISTFVDFSTVCHVWNAHDFDHITGIESHVRVMAWHDRQLVTWQDPCMCSTIYCNTHNALQHTSFPYVSATSIKARLSTPLTWLSTSYVTRPMYIFNNIYTHTHCRHVPAMYILYYDSQFHTWQDPCICIVRLLRMFDNVYIHVRIVYTKCIRPRTSKCIRVMCTLSNRFMTLIHFETHESCICSTMWCTYATSNIYMGWLRWVGSLKWWVSFAKEPYKGDYILQKRPIILISLLIVATQYQYVFIVCKNVCLHPPCRWNKDGYIIIFRCI